MKRPSNLFLLGLGAVLIALVTTSISVYVYHASGDIYLDRSRPGFLPEDAAEASAEAAPVSNYKFPDTGALDDEALDEYLTELRATLKGLDDLGEPYAAKPLSDESLMLAIPENQS